MRQLILLLSITLSLQAQAMCSWSGLQVYPNSPTIESDSWIILEGFAFSQSIIDSLNIGYPVFLQSGSELIPLSVKYRYKGDFQLTQAVLTPDKKLTIGLTYFLKIDKLKDDEEHALTRWNGDTEEYEQVKWTVTAGNDTKEPELMAEPKLIDKNTSHYGCGPAVYAVFSLHTKDDSPIFIKTELLDLRTGKSTAYFLNDGGSEKLQVGHGMCAGAFKYAKKGRYKIRFQLYDTHGNTDQVWTEWIEFDSPYEPFR